MLWAAGDRQVRAGGVGGASRRGRTRRCGCSSGRPRSPAAGTTGPSGIGRRVGGGRTPAGWSRARFDHRMSRAGDPQIHSHVVVLNMSRTERDGRWRALDGQAIYRARGLGSATYEQVLMTELSRRLGVAWRLPRRRQGVRDRRDLRAAAGAVLRPAGAGQRAAAAAAGGVPGAVRAGTLGVGDRPDGAVGDAGQAAGEGRAGDHHGRAGPLGGGVPRRRTAGRSPTWSRRPPDGRWRCSRSTRPSWPAAAIAAAGEKKTAWTRADLAREVALRARRAHRPGDGAGRGVGPDRDADRPGAAPRRGGVAGTRRSCWTCPRRCAAATGKACTPHRAPCGTPP